MTDNKKKRSEEIGIEIKQSEYEYNRYLDEAKRALDIKQRFYEHEINKLSKDIDQFKYHTVIKAGKILERTGLVERNKICAKLKRDLKGYVSRARIYESCLAHDKKWIDTTTKHKGSNQYMARRADISSSQEQETEPPTPQDKQYVEAVERELITDQTIQKLIYEWTNKTTADQGAVLDRTPKGKHWSNILAEESSDFMRQLAYQMTISALGRRLEDIRIIKNIADKFGDILYEVYETRKKTESLESA
jgi:hypothetical protein